MKEIRSQKEFYNQHSNFINRTLSEYNIAPGIKCKFDLISSRIRKRSFKRALDVGCSGNSFIHFLPNVKHRIFCDLAYIPLTQYSRFRQYHPICGSIIQIPFKNNNFDLITALDVLEHIPDDKKACSELVRILEPRGLLVITVPHRVKYYTNQDRLCGHIRRYEYKQIRDIFLSHGLKELTVFPVYGQLMKVQFLQEFNPEKTEKNLDNLRKRYATNLLFRKIWDKFVAISSRLMKLDAKFQSFRRTMDICLIFRKPRL